MDKETPAQRIDEKPQSKTMFPEAYNAVKETLEIAEKYNAAYGVDVTGFLAFYSGYKASQDENSHVPNPLKGMSLSLDPKI